MSLWQNFYYKVYRCKVFLQSEFFYVLLSYWFAKMLFRSLKSHTNTALNYHELTNVFNKRNFEWRKAGIIDTCKGASLCGFFNALLDIFYSQMFSCIHLYYKCWSCYYGGLLFLFLLTTSFQRYLFIPYYNIFNFKNIIKFCSIMRGFGVIILWIGGVDGVTCIAADWTCSVCDQAGDETVTWSEAATVKQTI